MQGISKPIRFGTPMAQIVKISYHAEHEQRHKIKKHPISSLPSVVALFTASGTGLIRSLAVLLFSCRKTNLLKSGSGRMALILTLTEVKNIISLQNQINLIFKGE